MSKYRVLLPVEVGGKDGIHQVGELIDETEFRPGRMPDTTNPEDEGSLSEADSLIASGHIELVTE